VDERHRNGLAAITTKQKPRGGSTEMGCYLSDARRPGRPYTATACKVRALVDRYRSVHIIVTADLDSDLCHADPKRVQQRED
jgi:hypothetical protein